MAIHRSGRVLEAAVPVRTLRQEHDRLVSRVEQRLGPLTAEHKAFITIILRHGGTFEQVARLRGEHASTVSRRFHRLLSKLAAHGVPHCRPMALSPLERSILVEYYLCGRSQTTIADKFGISRYRVRKTLARIRSHGDRLDAAGGAA